MSFIKKNILSIDIGGSKLLAGIIDNDGNILSKKKLLLETPITEDYLRVNIENLIEDLLNNSNENIECIGATVPGLADIEKGILVYAPYSGIRNFKIGNILKKKLRIPVFIENDANACAYAEMMYGVCKEVDNFIWVTISNGVGGALVINGEIYEGEFGGAGEIGHINVVNNGYMCGCGNKGCLEAYAAGPAIVRRYKKKTQDDSSGITAEMIAESARKGDEVAQDIYKKTGYYLGKAISYAVNLLNPAKVILGGGISMSIDLFLPELKRVINKMVLGESVKNLIIEKTGLSYEAALMGAATIAKLRSGGK